MPQRGIAVSRAQSPQVRPDNGTWQTDYADITGEQFSLANFITRTYPHDLANVIAAWVRAHKSGVFDYTYHLKDRYGCLVLVRGRVWRDTNGEWVGVLRRVSLGDRPWVLHVPTVEN